MFVLFVTYYSHSTTSSTCWMADANFHDDWTSVDSTDSSFTGYFLKETSKPTLSHITLTELPLKVILMFSCILAFKALQ